MHFAPWWHETFLLTTLHRRYDTEHELAVQCVLRNEDPKDEIGSTVEENNTWISLAGPSHDLRWDLPQ